MNTDWIHFLATFVWGVYGLVIGSLTIVNHFGGLWVWVSIIVAITGNSAHLVSFALSKSGIISKAIAGGG